MSLLTASAERVSRSTPQGINRRIRSESERRVRSLRDDPAGIQARLNELDHEWDIERAIETNASSLVVLGTVLGLTVDRRFLAVPLAVGGFLLQHALQGWCPPIPVLRRLGFRTQREIEDERQDLLALLTS